MSPSVFHFAMGKFRTWIFAKMLNAREGACGLLSLQPTWGKVPGAGHPRSQSWAHWLGLAPKHMETYHLPPMGTCVHTHLIRTHRHADTHTRTRAHTYIHTLLSAIILTLCYGMRVSMVMGLRQTRIEEEMIMWEEAVAFKV